jgi:hypothetical protein
MLKLLAICMSSLIFFSLSSAMFIDAIPLDVVPGALEASAGRSGRLLPPVPFVFVCRIDNGCLHSMKCQRSSRQAAEKIQGFKKYQPENFNRRALYLVLRELEPCRLN